MHKVRGRLKYRIFIHVLLSTYKSNKLLLKKNSLSSLIFLLSLVKYFLKFPRDKKYTRKTFRDVINVSQENFFYPTLISCFTRSALWREFRKIIWQKYSWEFQKKRAKEKHKKQSTENSKQFAFLVRLAISNDLFLRRFCFFFPRSVLFSFSALNIYICGAEREVEIFLFRYCRWVNRRVDFFFLK